MSRLIGSVVAIISQREANAGFIVGARVKIVMGDNLGTE